MYAFSEAEEEKCDRRTVKKIMQLEEIRQCYCQLCVCVCVNGGMFLYLDQRQHKDRNI